MVMLVSSPDARTPRMRENYLSERIFEWAGIGASHVSNRVLRERTRPDRRDDSAGRDDLPTLGKRADRLSIVSAKDVARVAVGVLQARQ